MTTIESHMWPIKWHQLMALNDLEGHSSVAGLFKCNPSNICVVAFYQISTDSVLARSLSDNWASCSSDHTASRSGVQVFPRTTSLLLLSFVFRYKRIP